MNKTDTDLWYTLIYLHNFICAVTPVLGNAQSTTIFFNKKSAERS